MITCRQVPYCLLPIFQMKQQDVSSFSCRGRVVKAMDQKSIGIFPRRFESCRQRFFSSSNFRNQLISDLIFFSSFSFSLLFFYLRFLSTTQKIHRKTRKRLKQIDYQKCQVPTRLELVTFCVLSRRDNHYTTEPLPSQAKQCC